MRRLLVVFAAVSLLGALSMAPTAAPAAKKAHVFSPNAHPFGATLGEWQARWFKWFLEIPAPINPLLDDTGEFCAVGQSGTRCGSPRR